MSIEIIIIVCLAIALFLLLRHYPESKMSPSFLNRENLARFLDRFPKRKKKTNDLDSIKQAIVEGQDKVISPADIEKATKSYQEDDPFTARILYQAEEALMANDLRLADELAIDAISKNNRCAQAYVIIGKIAFHRGEFDDAKEAYKTAIKCNKDLAEAYFGLGRTEFRMENFTGAIENLQRSINLEKGHADWYAELGKAHMEVRQYAKAAKVLKRATSLDIDNKDYKDLAAEAEEKQRTHSFYGRAK